jgi:hypothetical protein
MAAASRLTERGGGYNKLLVLLPLRILRDLSPVVDVLIIQ